MSSGSLSEDKVSSPWVPSLMELSEFREGVAGGRSGSGARVEMGEGVGREEEMEG